MTTNFKPLEESVGRLQEYASKGDTRRFLAETKEFYRRMATLGTYTWMGQRTVELTRHYQKIYDQTKLLLESKRDRLPSKDVGQIMEGDG